MPRLSCLCLLIALTLLVPAGPGVRTARAGEKEDAVAAAKFTKAVKGWREVRKSHNFGMREHAVEQIARLGTPQAMAYLLRIGSKGRPYGGEHFEQVLVATLARHFPFATHADAWLEAFTTNYDEPKDAWLAYRVFSSRSSTEGDRALLKAMGPLAKLPYHRAAALRALARRANPVHLALVDQTLATLPGADAERAVLIEGAAALLAGGAKDGVAKPASKDRIERLIALLDREDLPARSRLAIGRTLARLLEADIAYADSASWHKHLGRKEAEVKLAKEGYATKQDRQPTFLGIRSLGRDIVYVIDVSSSMGVTTEYRGPTKRPGKQRRRGRGGPVTGESGRDAEERKAEEEGREAFDPFAGLEDIDPKRIHTRLDLLKEALKASIRRLQPTQRFAIVIFGSDARPLLKSDGLVPATRKNVESAVKRVHSLSPSGGTNAHRGLEIGFQLPCRTDTAYAFVEDRPLLEGADTVFFLSDGAPSTDSYSHGEEDYLARRGPILEAVRRWNLFRDCEIHSIGFTGASEALMKGLARIGRGRFVDLGL